MNTEKGICVDGFKVHCDVIELPSGKLFSAQHEAERHAKWILKGIRRVDASGVPQFCLT